MLEPLGFRWPHLQMQLSMLTPCLIHSSPSLDSLFALCCTVDRGGREGFASYLNTDIKRELDHMAAFLRMAVAHKNKIGFGGQLLVEPKPKEP